MAMPDYERMYLIMRRAAVGALDLLPETKDTVAGRYLLQFALFVTEKLDIQRDEEYEEE